MDNEVSDSSLTNVLPSPQPYEVALALKFQSHSSPTMSIMMLVTKMDINRDGCISKEELRNGLYSMWGIKTTNREIDGIFHRMASIKHQETHDACRRNNIDETNMTYADIVRYIRATLAHPSTLTSQTYGASLPSKDNQEPLLPFSPPNTMTGRRRQYKNDTPKTKLQNVKKRLFTFIHQGAGGVTDATRLFLKIDVNRDNRVTACEFQQWAKDLGLDMDMELVRLILWGEEQQQPQQQCSPESNDQPEEEMMDLTQFLTFVHRLEEETANHHGGGSTTNTTMAVNCKDRGSNDNTNQRDILKNVQNCPPISFRRYQHQTKQGSSDKKVLTNQFQPWGSDIL